MTTAHASLIALALALAGMASLSFAMDRHHEQLTNQRDVPVRARWMLRVAGVALLAAAIAPCVAAWGASVGVVAWLGFLSAGALLVALLLAYRPRGLAGLAVCASVAGLGGLALAFTGAMCWK
ncbi:DUF3325 domain-containing protein [Variovorax sp. J22G73]|jgi:hypothetical protein|uniref:DUF3325 domain-containing protein n=1 Tax=unclassified Variovorax TaxID=663243 RepID=UPI000D5F2C0D|nr:MULTISPECIES: DUF3325 domain-containing protein [unclassified Variovorax]MDM0007270.1 DUF3325 domain-containing protein [Variovorax sp. J22R203]MDM0098978.1 DUF3325 domain-containing protein [Variovorax sp. J22G73]